LYIEQEGLSTMSQVGVPASKDITLHWRNFIIVILFIIVVGIIIGLIITPHPKFQARESMSLIQKQWTVSLHAGSLDTPEESERMNQPGCAHCHTAQGYWREILEGEPSAAPYENAIGITCEACHFPDGLELGDAALRAGTARTACTGCHDILVQNDTGGFSSCLQGSMLRGEGGSEFEGRDYPAGPHGRIAERCVGCHMAPSPEGDAALKLGGHTFRVITKGEEPHLFNNAACRECHEELTLEDVRQSQAEVRELMERLAGLLPRLDSGEPRLPEDPTLSEKEAKAAYNYYFVQKDGTLGVHNPEYIRALLTDSISILGSGQNKSFHAMR
jgi:formate-dependent nitrite reductase cytochrome c552 subunit